MAKGINKLTALQVKNAGDGRHQDGGGLFLDRRNGSGRWVWRFQLDSKRRDMGLGSQAALSLAEARAERDKWASFLARGLDPIVEREKEREAARQANADPTFAAMVDIAFEALRATLKGDGVAGRWRSPLDLYVIPAIGDKRVTELHQIDIRDALAPIWRDKHETARKASNRTRMVLRHAQLSGFDCDPVMVDQAKHMLGAVEHIGTPIAATPWQDIPDLFAKLTSGSAADECLRFCILTLVRSAGCRGARFDEIADGVWTVPADRVKGRRGRASDFRVPLSKAAQDVVDRAAAWGGELLFPGRRRNPISDQALTKRLNAVGEPGRVHGFRTSFRTWVQDTEACTWEVSEKVLDHTIGGAVERSYARSDMLDRRQLVMDAWGAYVTGATSSTVVQMRR